MVKKVQTFANRPRIKIWEMEIPSSRKIQIFFLGYYMQGQTGRVFQLRVGSGSGIEKIFRVGSGIGYLYQIPSHFGIMG